MEQAQPSLSTLLSATGFEYKTKREALAVGSFRFELESLADIDQTIDDLFLVYQAEGKTELFEEMCPYFGMLWPAGRVLAEYLARDISRFHGEKKILEIGCGLAVPSLVLARHGIGVFATDVHPDVPLFLKRNRELNALRENEPRFVAIDWREDRAEGGPWDLILASDVLYDKTQPASLLAFLQRSLRPGGKLILADPGRTYVQGFFEEAAKNGFSVQTEGLYGVLIGEVTRNVIG
ncbi:MAG: methyltransferase [Bdellovibrionales bacterium]|jgi:predicted nicotinamide N-methyase|nr:methyltransferase [Bdellovibrionales bacterium]